MKQLTDQTRPDHEMFPAEVACVAQCGGLLVICGTTVGRSNRLFRYGTQTENIRQLEWSAVSECTVRLFSGWVEEPRPSPRYLAHAYFSHSCQGSYPGLWTVH